MITFFRPRRFRLRLRGRLSAARQPQPSQRGPEDAAADPSGHQRFGHDHRGVQGRPVEVGERPAAVRLQGLLHGKVMIIYHSSLPLLLSFMDLIFLICQQNYP